MFTGIIEELGIVKSLAKASNGARLIVISKVCSADAKIGDSISVNGACLTIIDIKGSDISFDVSEETLGRSSLSRLTSGDRVNLERSLRPDSRLGGHFVTGHVDCAGKIIARTQKGEYLKIDIEIPEAFIRYLAEKGSVAIDGISLTVNSVGNRSFSVMIIPHTLSMTTLAWKKEADILNIETDILAKYVENLTKRSSDKSTSNITKNLLKEHGFI